MRNTIHSHLTMEQQLGLPTKYCIVDRCLLEEIINVKPVKTNEIVRRTDITCQDEKYERKFLIEKEDGTTEIEVENIL